MIGLKDEKHSKWDKKDYPKNANSGRQCPVGYVRTKKNILKHKIIKPINICPICKSNNTYHAVVNNKLGDEFDTFGKQIL